jgi:hypothetical protein
MAAAGSNQSIIYYTIDARWCQMRGLGIDGRSIKLKLKLKSRCRTDPKWVVESGRESITQQFDFCQSVTSSISGYVRIAPIRKNNASSKLLLHEKLYLTLA